MKIGIDVRLWNQTGVGRYIRNLVSNLSDIDKKNEYVLFARSEDTKEIKSTVKDSKFEIVKTDISWHGIAEQTKLPTLLNKHNLDLVHFPYFSVPIFYKKPFVITIHDLIVKNFNTGKASTLPFPLYYAKRLGYHAVLGSAIKRAAKIIVPSSTVAENMKEEYPLSPEDKIVVTYEGGFSEEIKKTSNKKLVDGDYLVRVGNFYPHKNTEGLLNAISSINDDQLKLVLVGKRDYFYDKIKKLVDKLNIDNKVVFIENPSDEELVELYKNAAATVVPSFAEGFSLTTVEAMSVGSLVLASDIPVHREICGVAAIYCNPEDPNDIKQKIELVLSLSKSEKEKIIKKGYEQSKKFSWEKMAKETLTVYETSA